MRQRFEPRQAEKAASALDGVNQPKNVIEDLGVVRVLLEPHQLIVDRVQALAVSVKNSRNRSSMKPAFERTGARTFDAPFERGQIR